MSKKYPGIAVLGGEKISALYGVDNGIIDWQGVGIQHFFHRNYEDDLIHSAVTFLRHNNGVIEVGNRRIDGKRHPEHQHPLFTDTIDGYLLKTEFESQENKNILWVEEVFATEDNKIIFETSIFNKSLHSITIEVGGYFILRNPDGGEIEKVANNVIWKGNNTSLYITMEKVEKINFNVESPTGFVYRTLQKLRSNENETKTTLETNNYIGLTLSRILEIPVGHTEKICFGIFASDVKDNNKRLENWEWEKEREKARNYWRGWLDNEVNKLLELPPIIRKHYEANLVAIKGALLEGFVPADITGHYFSKGSPSYYARDAMMIARAFILSGHYSEAKDIINYLIKLPTKNNSGEFYQRYNSKGEPSEGSNNNVFNQLDSQGYFLRNLLTYYERTNEWLLPFENVRPYVDVLFSYLGIQKLIGPEGGVNEGVFGPAYITSSNMFIYGGLMAAAEIARIHHDNVSFERWRNLAIEIDKGIQSTWVQNERYGYGFTTYADEVVEKYDAPQYFGSLYGYPINQRMLDNNQFLLKNASFFNHGIGYTEQEYHHGPWLFNTGACAQFQALIGNYKEYRNKVYWMVEHSNGYGLMPEAIDANNENISFINPLTWACAEFVSTISIMATKDGFNLGTLGDFSEAFRRDEK